MIARRLLTGLLLLCLIHSCYSQEYSYTHYDNTDGLAGSVVYCITQDKDGFIWAGTETGVSRFDGTHFRNFTAADGLSDIEILNMFCDSRGRVWMAPFGKSISYYYRGRFHSQQNDPLLRNIHPRANIENYAEDAAGNILMQERTRLYLLTTAGKVREFDSIGNLPIRKCVDICRSASGHFLVQEGNRIYELTHKGFAPFREIRLHYAAPNYIAMDSSGFICWTDKFHTIFNQFRTGLTIQWPFDPIHYSHLTFSKIGDSLVYFNQFQGATEYNIYTGQTKLFLAGKVVSRTFRDATGNTWFTTLGQGIYRLNSNEFRTVHVKVPGMEESSIHAIGRIGNELMIGDNHNYAFQFSLRTMALLWSGTVSGSSRNRILDISYLSNGHLLLSSDRGLDECTLRLETRKKYEMPIKSILKKNDSVLIVGGGWGAGFFNVKRFKVTDTFWRDRCTTLFLQKETIYIGTLSGLYIMTPDRSISFAGKTIPFLRKRISGLAESSDGILWIASYDAGVIGYRDGRVVVTLDKLHGLTSDICRVLVAEGNILWIGTDKGLNKVALDKPGYPILQYNGKDGLASDIVNSIYVDRGEIYVATPSGLSYFNENRINESEGCRLHLLSIFNAGKDKITDSAHLLIPYSDKHVRFEFAGISYRSVGSILYRYRMFGLDTGWQETKETFLEYPTLPSGKYTFELQAINKFGIRSAMLSLPFEVVTPFWQTVWFFVLVVASSLGLIWLFVALRIKRIRQRQKEKEALNLRLIEMEHTALQAQMNPHFIFNCLNSIQQFILDNEALAANRYLTDFSRLIRATLNNSSMTFISLTDEIDYLSTYLQLEKLRFNQKMDYSIDVDPAVDTDQCSIPPMLIQPFVENSMRHGLRHKTVGKGYIRICFALTEKELLVTVEDNGIGRKKAAVYKTREHIEYQSKGMSLTADRIRMINAKYNDNIHVDVFDLEDNDGQPAGTRVVMQFPLFHMTTQKETI